LDNGLGSTSAEISELLRGSGIFFLIQVNLVGDF